MRTFTPPPSHVLLGLQPPMRIAERRPRIRCQSISPRAIISQKWREEIRELAGRFLIESTGLILTIARRKPPPPDLIR